MTKQTLVLTGKGEDQILVKLVQYGMDKWYLHFHTVWRELHIPKANHYKFLTPLIEYLEENVKPLKMSSYYPYRDYSIINWWWRTIMSPDQIVELINKSEYHRESAILKRIAEFLSTSDEVVYKKYVPISTQQVSIHK